MNTTPKPTGPLSPLLLSTGVAGIPATTERLIVKDHFHRHPDSPITTVCLAFKRHFFGKIEIPTPEVRLGRYRLLQPSATIPIMAELGGPTAVKTTVAAIAALVLRHDAKKGVLQTDGLANLFFVPDKLWELRAVTLVWAGRGWTVDALAVTDRAVWGPGHQIFSPIAETADGEAGDSRPTA